MASEVKSWRLLSSETSITVTVSTSSTSSGGGVDLNAVLSRPVRRRHHHSASPSSRTRSESSSDEEAAAAVAVASESSASSSASSASSTSSPALSYGTSSSPPVMTPPLAPNKTPLAHPPTMSLPPSFGPPPLPPSTPPPSLPPGSSPPLSSPTVSHTPTPPPHSPLVRPHAVAPTKGRSTATIDGFGSLPRSMSLSSRSAPSRPKPETPPILGVPPNKPLSSSFTHATQAPSSSVSSRPDTPAQPPSPTLNTCDPALPSVEEIDSRPQFQDPVEEHQHLLYSDRESSLIQDIYHLLITKYPKVLNDFFLGCENRERWDLYAESIITASFARSTTLSLIRYFVNDEFQNHPPDEPSFRDNCIASKVIKSYLRKVGSKYLCDMLGDVMHKICIAEQKISYEIDPGKLESHDEVLKRQILLQNKMDTILARITDPANIDKMPPGVRLVAAYFFEMAQKYCPESNPLAVVGSFLILRYINPAIFSPEQYGMIRSGKVSPLVRRNLVLLSKMLQNISSGLVFTSKEQYMVAMNRYIEQNVNRLHDYFKVVIAQASSTTNLVIDSDICAVSLKDLHLLHLLLFQHKEHSSTLISVDTDRRMFEKKLEDLGSYSNKVSFAFAGSAAQKQVKDLLMQRKEEASYIGYLTVPAKKGPDKVTLVVGLNRIFTVKKGGKVGAEGHFVDLKEIVSLTPREVRLIFAQSEIAGESDQADDILYSVRRAFEQNFGMIPEAFRFRLNVSPPTRVSKMQAVEKKCGGFVDAYKSLCNYHNVACNMSLCWDVENLYTDNTKFNLHHFFSEESGGDTVAMATSELAPVFQALWHNTHFTWLLTKDRKLEKTFPTLVDMLHFNCHLTSLTLVNVNLSSSNWAALFDAMGSNPQCIIQHIDVSSNPVFDERVVNSLATFLSTSKAPHGVETLEMADTLTNPKAVLAAWVMLLSIQKIRGMNTLLHLDISGNKIGDNTTQLAQWLGMPGNPLTYLNIRNTSIATAKIASIFGAISQGCRCMKTLVASGLKISRPEEATHLAQIISVPALSNLDLSESIASEKIILDLLQPPPREGTINLMLRSCGLGLVAAKILRDIAPKLTSITSLDLGGNELGDDGIILVVEGIMLNTTLLSLNMNGCFGKGTRLRTDVVRALQKLIVSDCPLESLKIAGGMKATQQMSKLMLPFLHSLASNESITEIDVSGHAMGNPGAIALAKVLQVNTRLTSVHWDDNSTSLLGLTAMCNALKANQTLRCMPVPIGDISSLLSSNLPEDIKKRVRALSNELQQALVSRGI
ncbi:RasGTPase-activating protein [Pelomyxa schiedti]|nr:RasGTPase-activating protein [Pelomyxa schiedti]